MRHSTTGSDRPVRRRTLWVLAVVALVLGALPIVGPGVTQPASAADGPTVPGGFSISRILGTDASPLNHPIAVRFAPDGRVFVAEQTGRIWVFPNVNATSGTLFADLSSQVQEFWDRGLIGLAVDPHLLSGRPYVYVSFTEDQRWGAPGQTWGDGCPTPPGPTTDGCTVPNEIVKLTVAANGTGNTAVAQTTILSGWCQQYPSHSIGDLRIGPDGNLWATGGEGSNFDAPADTGNFGGNPCGDPTNEGGGLRAQSPRRTDGPTLLSGAAIRINPDTGAGVPGNPWYGSPDANKARILAYGMRNPFRWTFKPGTSEMWIGNVGQSTWESVFRVPASTTSGGGAENFGWPCYEGRYPQPGYQSEPTAAGMCGPLYANTALVTSPWFSYHQFERMTDEDGGVSPNDTCSSTASPGGATSTGSSISGLAFAPTSGPGLFPAQYRGRLFYADYARSCIYSIDASGNSGSATTVATFADGIGATDLQFGPDGALYTVDLNGGWVYRIAANGSPSNLPPVARISASVTAAAPGQTITFDGRASSDPENGPLTYQWDLNGDGNYDNGTASTASASFGVGSHVVRLRVTDNTGQQSIAAVTVTVGGTPPAPWITSPSSSLQWTVGQPITYSGVNFGANLPDSAFHWQIMLHHCSGGDINNCHIHNLVAPTGRSGSFNAPDHAYPSYLTFELTVTDPVSGLAAEASVNVYPRTASIAITSVPGEVPVTAGDSSSTNTPFTKTVIQGSAFAVDAPLTFNDGASDYTFAGWSDGGAANHSFAAQSRTLTARYRAVDRATTGPITKWSYEDIIHGGSDPVAVNYLGAPHVFSNVNNVLAHSWYDGAWRTDYPSNVNGASGISTMSWGGQLHAFYQDDAGRLEHTYWTGRQWLTETLDAAPTDDTAVVEYNGQPHLFYRRSTDNQLLHMWWDGRAWRRDNPAGAVTAGSDPSISASTAGGRPVVFYNADDALKVVLWTGAQWTVDTVDAAGGTDTSAIATGYGPFVFYRGADGSLRRGSWNWGWLHTVVEPGADAQDISVGAMQGSTQVTYVDGSGTLRLMVWGPNGLTREALDGPQSTGRGRSPDRVAGTTMLGIWGQAQIWYHDVDGDRLAHTWS